MDEEFKLKKSQLRNAHTQELKPLEKDLKKKKGDIREKVHNTIESTKLRHAKELEELEKSYGVVARKEERGNTKTADDDAVAIEGGIDGDWKESSEPQTKAVSPSGAFNKPVKTKPDSNAKKAAAVSSASSSEESSSEDSSSSGSETDGVIPDALRQKGREGDSRGMRKRTDKKKYTRGKQDRQNKNKNNNNEKDELTEEERQAKREAVMAQVLMKLLEKKPNGVLVANVEKELKKLNVTNFRPQLLGYATMEEWILNQAPGVLQYDAEEKRIMPGRGLPQKHE